MKCCKFTAIEQGSLLFHTFCHMGLFFVLQYIHVHVNVTFIFKCDHASQINNGRGFFEKCISIPKISTKLLTFSQDTKQMTMNKIKENILQYKTYLQMFTVKSFTLHAHNGWSNVLNCYYQWRTVWFTLLPGHVLYQDPEFSVEIVYDRRVMKCLCRLAYCI